MRAITYFLCVILTLQGCGIVGLRYHDDAGDMSALKVAPYWEGDSGEKYLVGGLKVELHPRGGIESPAQNAITCTKEALMFQDLEPGKYRLKVFVNPKIKVSKTIELKRGKRLTVKIDVDAAKSKQNFKEAMGDVGEAITDTCVVIGSAIIVIGIVALKLVEDREDRLDNNKRRTS